MKLTNEHYCNVFDDIYDVATKNFRYFTVYGPRMHPNMAISNFVSRCLNDEPPVIFGDGKQTRDFTFIDDVVEANFELLHTNAADGETINIGLSDNISIWVLSEYVVDETGANVDIVHENAKEADAQHTHADVSKAADLIGFEPETEIRDGVARFIDWYEVNRDWHDPLVISESNTPQPQICRHESQRTILSTVSPGIVIRSSRTSKSTRSTASFPRRTTRSR